MMAPNKLPPEFFAEMEGDAVPFAAAPRHLQKAGGERSNSFLSLDGEEKLFELAQYDRLTADVRFNRSYATYAHGYQRSAEMLFDAISQGDGGYADAQYFALAFLWRQALELSLKALYEDLALLDVLENLDDFDGVLKEPPFNHNLLKLWQGLEPHLLRIFPTEPETAWLAKAIEQFHQIDPGAEGFRYPTFRDGASTLEALPGVVSFQALDANMRALLNTLGGAAGEIHLRLDAVMEWIRNEERDER